MTQGQTDQDRVLFEQTETILFSLDQQFRLDGGLDIRLYAYFPATSARTIKVMREAHVPAWAMEDARVIVTLSEMDEAFAGGDLRFVEDLLDLVTTL